MSSGKKTSQIRVNHLVYLRAREAAARAKVPIGIWVERLLIDELNIMEIPEIPVEEKPDKIEPKLIPFNPSIKRNRKMG
jgi:hypothetical protein